jgi:hypothetical protein
MAKHYIDRAKQVWRDSVGEFRVMVSHQGWHMCRRKAGIPFTISEGEFKKCKAWIGNARGGRNIIQVLTTGEPPHDENQ